MSFPTPDGQSQDTDEGIFVAPLAELYRRTGTNDRIVAAALHAAGIRVTAQYLGQVRRGLRRNVGSDVVRGLEAYFDVQPGFFFQAAATLNTAMDPVLAALRREAMTDLVRASTSLTSRDLSFLIGVAELIQTFSSQ